MARPFFTYILQCSDESYYVGHTDELEPFDMSLDTPCGLLGTTQDKRITFRFPE